MSEVPATLVKQLRELTGAGFMDCKRALEEANGDLEAAQKLLRERGVGEMSLNFATFGRWIHSPTRWHERVLGRLVALANPFFQIESLYRFNAKFFLMV